MKSIIIILSLSFYPLIGNSQNSLEVNKDSLVNLSRVKADKILSQFDSLQTTIILYSISDKYYFLIFKESHSYKESYINTDSLGNVKRQRFIEKSSLNKKTLSKVFNLDNYHKGFITNIKNPEVVMGNNSYFVVKDKAGNRYGEYSLPVITLPIPIDKELYNYVFSRLLQEATK